MSIIDNPKLAALMARIKADVVIRKRSNGSTTVETNASRAKRELRERGNDPALRALMLQSNMDSKHFHAKLDPYRFFHEVAKTVVLQKQLCRCCESEQMNVVAEMLHLRGKASPDSPIVDVWIRRSTVAQLPHEDPILAPAHTVEFCADCITAAAVTSCWTAKDAHNIPEGSGQLPLIH